MCVHLCVCIFLGVLPQEVKYWARVPLDPETFLEEPTKSTVGGSSKPHSKEFVEAAQSPTVRNLWRQPKAPH